MGKGLGGNCWAVVCARSTAAAPLRFLLRMSGVWLLHPARTWACSFSRLQLSTQLCGGISCFTLHFLMLMMHFFMYLFVVCMSLMKFLDFLPNMKNWVIFLVELREFFIYSGYTSCIRYVIFAYFLPNLGSPFQNCPNSIFQ